MIVICSVGWMYCKKDGDSKDMVNTSLLPCWNILPSVAKTEGGKEEGGGGGGEGIHQYMHTCNDVIHLWQ